MTLSMNNASEFYSKSIFPYSPLYWRSKALYESSFPVVEQVSFSWMTKMALFKKADFRAYFSGGRFCGFTYSLSSEKAFFLLFIAVDPSKQSIGLGSLILQEIAKQAGKRPIYLAIEPMDENAENYSQRVKRLAFYEKNGFQLTDLYYYEDQEAYQVMSNQPNHDQTDFKNLAMEVAGSGMNIQVLEEKNEKNSQN